MNHLLLKIDVSSYLRSTENNQKDSEIELLISNDSQEILLFHIKWDPRPLIEWLGENKDNILNDQLPYFFSPNKCIAEAISEFYDDVDPDDDDLLDKAQEYRMSHGLRFAMRGARLPDIYLGKRDDSFEVSGGDESSFWFFKINGNDFFSSLPGNPPIFSDCQK